MLEGIAYGVPLNTRRVIRERITTYESGTDSLTVYKSYKYNIKGLLKRETTHDPLDAHGPDSLSTLYTYPPDFWPSQSGDTLPLGSKPPWLVYMMGGRLWRYPVEVKHLRGERIVGVTANSYDAVCDAVTGHNASMSYTPAATWQLTQAAPTPDTGAYRKPWINMLDVAGGPPIAIVPQLRQMRHVATANGRLPGVMHSATAPPTAYYWNTRLRHLKAVVRNGVEHNAAVEDFEEGWRSSSDGWTPTSHGDTTWHITRVRPHTGRLAMVPVPLPPSGGLPNRPAAPKTLAASLTRTSHQQLPTAGARPDTIVLGNPCDGQLLDSDGSIPEVPANAHFVSQKDPFWCLSAALPAPDTVGGAPEYILSFWARTDSARLPAASMVGVWLSPGCNQPRAIGVTSGDWKLYRLHIRFSKSNYELLLGGNAVILDDLRLYPADARVTTYTHEPLVGVRSVLDEGDRLTTYEYDPAGRLRAVRDNEGHLLSTEEYHFQPTR